MNRLIPSSLILPLCLFLTISQLAFGQTADHSCGEPNVHNPNVAYGQVVDIDGNVYKTVVVDQQVWFSENLKVSRFQNGDVIPAVSDSATWAGLTGPGMCSYKNNSSYDCPYGKLYNFFVATDIRNPCPAGWRVPSKADYDKLINHFDSTANGGAPSNMPNIAGGFLKSTGLTYWQSPNTSANNLSGFSALPNGGRNNAGVFSIGGNTAASYWYSSEVGPGMGFFLQLPYNQEFAVRNAYFAGYGCCIRCVTDVGNVGVEESKMADLAAYPNPASDYISVYSEKNLLGKEYNLTDLAGRIHCSGKILSTEQQISLVALPAGMYFLQISSTDLPATKIIKR